LECARWWGEFDIKNQGHFGSAIIILMIIIQISYGQLPNWNYCGGNIWSSDTNILYGGLPSQKTEIINCGKSSCEFGNVTGPGTISFAWLKSSNNMNPAYDVNYSFYIDKIKKSQCDNDINWTNIKLPVESGEHELKWLIKLDSETPSGNCPSFAKGQGWIANTTYKPSNDICEIQIRPNERDQVILEDIRRYDRICVSSGANLQNIFNNLRILQQERILHHKTFLLESGTYDPVEIHAKNVTIESKPNEVATIDGIYREYSIKLNQSDNINIEGITLRNSQDYGLLVENSRKCTISENDILSFHQCGISVVNSSLNYINQNHISSTYEHSKGVWLCNSSSTSIADNIISTSNSLFYLHNYSCNNIIMDRNNEQIYNNGTIINESEGTFKVRDSNEDYKEQINTGCNNSLEAAN
jgi:parallel beta-helix repeat protein